MQLWSAASNGKPGARLADLVVPFPFTLERIPGGLWWERFTAPAGTQLNANTTYYVIAFTTLDSSSSDNNIFSVQRNSDDAEDSGSASGWSIANAYRVQRTSAPTASQAWGRTSTGSSLKIRVNGAVVTQSSDNALSGLTATSSTSAGGTFTSLAIGTFSSTTTSYTATVANARTHVKLTPTANHASASISWRKGATGSFTSVTSGSATTAISLGVGANAITVRVTAEDTTTQHYTVTVTRQAQQGSTVPTGLSVTTGNAQLTASWTAPSGVDVARYEAQIKLKSAASWPTGDTDVTGTSHTFTGLTNGSPYQVRVRTVETGEGVASAWSAPVEGTPQAAQAPPTVTLSVSPNPVLEGRTVDVTVTLSRTLSSNVIIPVTVTAGSAESGDYSTGASAITISAGNLSSTFALVITNQDDDEEDETLTVALGTLPSTVTAGTETSVTLTITDDDGQELSVDTSHPTPACGAAVTDLAVRPETGLRLTPPPTGATAATQVRILASYGPAEGWRASLPIRRYDRLPTYGHSGFIRGITFAELRKNFPGFTGFEYRLEGTPAITAQCTWQFDDEGGGGTGTDARLRNLQMNSGN